MEKSCANCMHYGTQRKYGDIIGPCCLSQHGKKWPIHVAQKVGRCGPRKTWWSSTPKRGAE